MRKLTNWGTKEAYEIISLEMQVEITPDMVHMIDHKTESKETRK